MICKAVADALAQAYPEIELFLTWRALLARNVNYRMRLLKDHLLYGAAVSSVPDGELAPVANLSRQVVRLIDPRRELPRAAALAIKAGVCAHHRLRSAAQIVELIRSTISQNGDLTALGVPVEEHEMFRASLLRVVLRTAPASARP